MNKLLRYFILCCCLWLGGEHWLCPAYAQQYAGSKTTTFTTSVADTSVNLTSSGITLHQLTWRTIGTVSGCSVKLEKSTDNSSWSDLITAQTCTSTGSATLTSDTTANFIRINTTSFTGTGSIIVTWIGYNQALGVGSYKTLNNIRFADQFSGVDTCAKITAAITDLASLGGTVDARAFHGQQNCTTTISIPSNTTILLDDITLSYIGGGISSTDFISGISADLGGNIALPVQFGAIVGPSKWNVLIEINTANTAVINSVVHFKWTGHMRLEFLSLRSRSNSTYTLEDEQTADTNLNHLALQNNLTADVAGQASWYCKACGYGHWLDVSASGGENPILWETSNTSIPTDVKTAIGFTGTDGLDLYRNTGTNLQAFAAWKSCFKADTPVATNKIAKNQITGLWLQNCGITNSGTLDEAGLYWTVSTVSTSEQIQNNKIFGVTYESNSTWGTHGIAFEGNVVRNQIFGIYTSGIGITNGSSFGLYFKNGTGVSPVENVIQGRIDISAAQTGNKAFSLDTNAARNHMTLNYLSNPYGDGTVPYTLSNTTNWIEGFTDVGQTNLGTFDFTSATSFLTNKLGTSRVALSNGTLETSSQIALGAGWGSTASVGTVYGYDQHFGFTVTTAGTGIVANPTFTITFINGTFTTVQHPVCTQVGGTDIIGDIFNTTASATAPIMTWEATPTTGKTYIIDCGFLGI